MKRLLVWLSTWASRQLQTMTETKMSHVLHCMSYYQNYQIALRSVNTLEPN